MPDQSPALLAVSAVDYKYGTSLALHDIGFSLPPGMMATLIGRNGAGKSTLLRCLAGWTRPANGEIVLDGVPLDRMERTARMKVLFVPDTPTFYDELTAWEHLRFIAGLHRLDGWADRAESLLDDFGLWAYRDSLPFTFSRGMRYKLALSMALVVAPPLLLLDEPFGPLDPHSASQLWTLLREYVRGGSSVLLSSHSLPTTDRPDYYLILEQGAIIMQGTPDELGRDHSLEELLRSALVTVGEVDGYHHEDEALLVNGESGEMDSDHDA